MSTGLRFKRHLIHTATVRRPTSSQTDSGELQFSWADVGTVVCRFVESREGVASESVGFAMQKIAYLLTAQGEDIQEEDEVYNIVDADSNSVVTGAYTIEGKLTRRRRSAHHMRFRLERVA